MPTLIEQLNPQELDVLRAIRQCGSASIPELSQTMENPPRGPVLRNILLGLERKSLISSAGRGEETVYVPLAVPAMEPAPKNFFARIMPSLFGGTVESEDLSFSDEQMIDLRHYVRETRAAKAR